jgi:RNA polymerase sigma factor (sigma-70 family)
MNGRAVSDVHRAEEERFRRLFNAAYRPLLAYALRRAESAADAEEIVAETFLVAWRRKRDLPSGDDAIPWLYGIARRVLANQHRSRARRRAIERLLRPLARVAGEPDDRAPVRAVVAAAQRLPAADQEVLRLAAWEDLSHAQIAVALGCTENAAALRLHRARKRLRAELMKEGVFPGQELFEVIP